MENLDTVLGIVVSVLSIIGVLFAKKNSDEIKKIKNILNINTSKIKKELFTNKKATSGNHGNSIIGDGNTIGENKK